MGLYLIGTWEPRNREAKIILPPVGEPVDQGARPAVTLKEWPRYQNAFQLLKPPSMIKRPVLELGGGRVLIGFKPEQYGAAFVPRH